VLLDRCHQARVRNALESEWEGLRAPPYASLIASLDNAGLRR